MRDQVPGTTRNGGRTKSAINNFQASGYVRAPEGVAQCLGLLRHRTEAPRYLTESPRYRNTAPVAGATPVDFCLLLQNSDTTILELMVRAKRA